MPVHVISMLIAVAALAVLLGQPAGDAFACARLSDLSTGSGCAAAPQLMRADVTGVLSEALGGATWHGFSEWVSASYQHAPALVLGLAALLAVPPLAFIGLLLRSKPRTPALDPEATDTEVVARADTRVLRRGGRKERLGLASEPSLAWPSVAWIELDGEAADGVRHKLARSLVRIGRESDNDIRLSDATVHRYHAAIRRNDDAEFIITDLSSAGGNGVTVNGRAVAEARLVDGDSIELGHAKLKFVARPSVTGLD